jgi:hypothetical protein
MPVIAGRNVGRNDLVVMAVGVLAFIDSFLPWYGVNGFGTASAWNSGFGAWFACILMVFVGVSVAARVFGGRNTGSVGSVGSTNVTWNLINLAVPVVAVIVILLRWVTYPDAPKALNLDPGARFGLYLGLILAIVQAVFSYFSFLASGERLPWQRTRS